MFGMSPELWTLVVAVVSGAFAAWLTYQLQTRARRDEEARQNARELRQLYAQLATRWYTLLHVLKQREALVEHETKVAEEGGSIDLDGLDDALGRVSEQRSAAVERLNEAYFALDLAESDETRRDRLSEFTKTADAAVEKPGGAIGKESKDACAALLSEARNELNRQLWQRPSRSSLWQWLASRFRRDGQGTT